MIIQALAEIGRKQPGSSHPHCTDKRIAGRLIAGSDGKPHLALVEKGKTVFGPFIEPTNKGKPGLGIYKWEYLLACKCANATAGKAGSARESVREHPGNRRNLRSVATFAHAAREGGRMPALDAVCDILDLIAGDPSVLEDLRRQAVANDLPGGAYVSLELDEGAAPWFQRPDVLAWWASSGFGIADTWSVEASPKPNSRTRTPQEPGAVGICSVTGERRPLRRLAIALEGFGKDTPRLAAFNRAAYQSRGLAKTLNAPMSDEIADLAQRGWQALVRDTESHHRVEDQVLVFWGDPVVKPWGEQARDPRVWKDLLQSPAAGRPVTSAPEGFHLLGMGHHKSNAFVVAWLQCDADRAAASIVRWGRWQTIAGSQQERYFHITDLLMALRPRAQWYRKRHTEEGTRLLDRHEQRIWRDLLYLAYGEGRVPGYVLNRLVERLGTELDPRPLDRLVLLNICLCSLNGLEVIDVDSLTSRQRNAYSAGRLFNLICYAQRKAIGETGKSMVTSNARLAATRPAAILGALITRANQVYLPKLRRDHPGTAAFVDVEIGRLMGECELAANHTPEEMGWFWKGFYSRDQRPIANTEESE